jgi:hypothetical protein
MTVELSANSQVGVAEFSYQDGYVLMVSDLGSEGVRIELTHPREGSATVIMPPQKVQSCAHWMLRTLALRKNSLPEELPEVLHRLVNNKTLRRGEKKKVRDAIQIIRRWESPNR